MVDVTWLTTTTTTSKLQCFSDIAWTNGQTNASENHTIAVGMDNEQ